MTITIVNDEVEYPKIIFDNPNGLNKGTYLAKPSDESLFQLPVFKNQGMEYFLSNNTKYIDLVVENNDVLNKLVKYLEDVTKCQIREKTGDYGSQVNY